MVAVSYSSWKKKLGFRSQSKLAGTRAIVWSKNAINKWLEDQLNNAPLERVPLPAPVTSGWITGSEALASVGRGFPVANLPWSTPLNTTVNADGSRTVTLGDGSATTYDSNDRMIASTRPPILKAQNIPLPVKRGIKLKRATGIVEIEQKWLIDDIISDMQMTAIVSMPGIGKSTFANALLLTFPKSIQSSCLPMKTARTISGNSFAVLVARYHTSTWKIAKLTTYLRCCMIPKHYKKQLLTSNRALFALPVCLHFRGHG